MYPIPKIKLGDVITVTHEDNKGMMFLVVCDYDEGNNQFYYTVAELEVFMIPYVKEFKPLTLQELAEHLSCNGKYEMVVKLNVKSLI